MTRKPGCHASQWGRLRETPAPPDCGRRCWAARTVNRDAGRRSTDRGPSLRSGDRSWCLVGSCERRSGDSLLKTTLSGITVDGRWQLEVEHLEGRDVDPEVRPTAHENEG